ncbi:MAG TPA: GNAT family N-acetyltransferase [Kribbella sp.]|nr:GNAT family N-acetyltransferase [Kribbella sp.]
MQTTAVLPDGYTVRPPELSDAEAIYELVSAYNTAAVGFADCTLDHIVDDLDEPGFDRKADGRLVLAADGRTVAYGTTFGKGNREAIDIDVVSLDHAVTGWLVDQTVHRALELGRENGHAEITVDANLYRNDEALRDLLAERGFTASTTYHRMQIDHEGPVAPPEHPAGVAVRRGALDDTTRRSAHALVNECFRGQFGFVARPYDEWHEARETRSTFDWSQLTLLEVGGRAVAVRECSDEFVPDENCGYIGWLGVLEQARGRGLAKFLLRDAFALDAAAGRSGTILHVDTNNPTPALDLYESVGMQPTLVIDVWRRVLPTA